MAETADDLSTPLGQETVRRKRGYRLPFTGPQALVALLGLFLVVFAGFAIFNDDPLGGEPIAHVALRQATPAGETPGTASPSTSETAAKPATKQAAPPAEHKTVTIIDGSSGARHAVLISGAATPNAEADKPPAWMR